jgi:hypothetical protein
VSRRTKILLTSQLPDKTSSELLLVLIAYKTKESRKKKKERKRKTLQPSFYPPQAV